MFSASLRWAAASALVLACAPRTDAAGFAIFEQGARGMGFAGAYTAQSADGSAIFHNAAGIAFLRNRQLYFGGTLIRPGADFTGANPFPGESVVEKGDVGTLVPPNAYYTQPINDRLAFGVGLHVPYGLETGWENRTPSPAATSPQAPSSRASRSTRRSPTSSRTGWRSASASTCGSRPWAWSAGCRS
jgi:long-chain fatty acid transport protein